MGSQRIEAKPKESGDNWVSLHPGLPLEATWRVYREVESCDAPIQVEHGVRVSQKENWTPDGENHIKTEVEKKSVR